MFQNNKVNLVISIVAAIIIWAYVVIAVNPIKDTTIKNIPVKLTSIDTLEDRGLTVTSDRDYTVDVTVKGARSEITQITEDDIEATADLFGYPEGDHDIKVVVTVPDNVSREDIKPASIEVSIDEYVSVSKPVKVEFDGDFGNNAEPGSVSVLPEELEVAGAKSIVEKVSYIKAAVNSEDVKDDEQTIEVEPEPVDEDGVTVDGLKLSQETISVNCTLSYVKTVPLEVPIRGKVDSAYEVTNETVPDRVAIKGTKTRLNNIKKVKAKTINISDITETTEIPLEISLPKEVELAEASSDLNYVIEISGISVKDMSFSSSEIELENVDENYDAHIKESTIKVAAYGSKTVIKGLKKGDLTLYIDMSDADYSKGVYTGTIQYKSDKDIQDIKIEPVEVEIIISELRAVE